MFIAELSVIKKKYIYLLLGPVMASVKVVNAISDALCATINTSGQVQKITLLIYLLII